MKKLCPTKRSLKNKKLSLKRKFFFIMFQLVKIQKRQKIDWLKHTLKMKKTLRFSDDTKLESIDEENEKVVSTHQNLIEQQQADRSNSSVRFNLEVSDQRKIIVKLRVVILKLGNISTKENRFSCEAFMEAVWYDLNFHTENNENKYDESMHWNPRLIIQNLVSNRSQEIWYHVEQTELGHKIAERRRFKGEFAQTFDLKKFPLDMQELLITISTLRSAQEVTLIMNKEKLSSINMSTFTQTHEWHLHEHVCNHEESTLETDYLSESRCLVNISVCVSRKPFYYYCNSFMLIFVITMICLCCFSISCDIVGNRLIVSITVLLTLITYKWSMSKSLPSLSYLTNLDQYSLMNILIVFLNCIYYALMGAFASENCTEPYGLIDFYAFTASMSIFILLNSFHAFKFFIYNYQNKCILEQREYEYSKNSRAKRARIKSIFQSSDWFYMEKKTTFRFENFYLQKNKLICFLCNYFQYSFNNKN